jgi:hypothetical protein
VGGLEARSVCTWMRYWDRQPTTHKGGDEQMPRQKGKKGKITSPGYGNGNEGLRRWPVSYIDQMTMIAVMEFIRRNSIESRMSKIEVMV